MDRFTDNQSERASLKVSQLERKWQEILEEERRSCLRNQKLLEDFHLTEQQSKVFAKKSDRLKQAKHNFELYVKSVYPRWTEELKQLQEVKKKKASKVSKSPSLLTEKDDRKEKKYSENLHGPYLVDSENIFENPTLSSTPYRSGVSFPEPDRFTHSVGLEKEKYQRGVPTHRGYPTHRSSNSGYPVPGMPYGMFPHYMGNYSLPSPHAMPWQNMNYSYECQPRYAFNPNTQTYLGMGTAPPGSSQNFQDYQADGMFGVNHHDNISSARTKSRDQRERYHHDGQASRNSQEYHNTDSSQQRNYEENEEQPRNVSENYASPRNQKTFQEKVAKGKVEFNNDANFSTDLMGDTDHHHFTEDSSIDENIQEERTVGKNDATEIDQELKVIKEKTIEASDKPRDLKNSRKNDGNSGGSLSEVYNSDLKNLRENDGNSGGSLREQVYNPTLNLRENDGNSGGSLREQVYNPTLKNLRENDGNFGGSLREVYNPTINQESTDDRQFKMGENIDENENSQSSFLTSEDGHNEHSVKELQMSKNSNEIPESDVDSSPLTSPKGPQDKHQDSCHEPKDPAQDNQIKSAKYEKSSERDITSKDEPHSSAVDDLLGDNVSDFEISGSEMSEDVPSEHEIGNDKESNVHILENTTEKSSIAQGMENLNIQNSEPQPSDDSVLNKSLDPKEFTINIDDAKKVDNIGTELYSQDEVESFNAPIKKNEEKNELQEKDLDSKDECNDVQAKEQLSENLDTLSKRQDDDQKDDEQKGDEVKGDEVKGDEVKDDEVKGDDGNSKSVGVLEDLSISSEDSSSVSVSLKNGKSDRKERDFKRRETRESVSYSKDFEDEKSIPLTETDAYQKMLSSVKFSDEEDIEEDLLGGSNMSEANMTGEKKQDENIVQSPRQQHVSQSSNNSKKPKASKSKLKLSVLSDAAENGNLENSLGKDSEGILTSSWRSSDMSLSPPLSPDVDEKKVEEKDKRKENKRMEGAEVKMLSTLEKGKIKQESNTKSRIQAGFWNHSDTESEVDLHVSHGADDGDDDDFDFYS